MHLPAEVVVALLSLLGTLIGSLTGIITSNKLVNYKIDEMQKDVNKLQDNMDTYNKTVERVAILERDNETQWREIDSIRNLMNKQ